MKCDKCGLNDAHPPYANCDECREALHDKITGVENECPAKKCKVCGLRPADSPSPMCLECREAKRVEHVTRVAFEVNEALTHINQPALPDAIHNPLLEALDKCIGAHWDFVALGVDSSRATRSRATHQYVRWLKEVHRLAKLALTHVNPKRKRRQSGATEDNG